MRIVVDNTAAKPSLRGLTWGSPEFVAIAKAAEEEGKQDDHFIRMVDEVCTMVNEINISAVGYENCRYKLKEAFDFYEECDCECY